jgi:hypothetical protein
LSTELGFYSVNYHTYVNALKADSTANPGNTVLATAIANLSKGNNANGAADMVVSGALLTMLELGTAATPVAVININSTQPFAFSRPFRVLSLTPQAAWSTYSTKCWEAGGGVEPQ